MEPLRVEAALDGAAERSASVVRYYELAKRAEWQVRDVPWSDIPPIPEARGSAEKKTRRQDVWRSVVTQQYQADILAVKMAAQLLNAAPHHEARLYYSTMVQDESRHVEAWLKLLGEIGGVAERDPHLDELARMFLDELDLLEEKVFLMQVFFERLIIPRFRLIARSSRGTVLEDICNRLTIDDGIHHGAGMAYERVLLDGATNRTKQKLVSAANRMLPIFVEHALWRPPARAWIGRAMHDRDVQRLREDLDDGVRLANSLGLDVSDVELPYLAAVRPPGRSPPRSAPGHRPPRRGPRPGRRRRRCAGGRPRLRRDTPPPAPRGPAGPGRAAPRTRSLPRPPPARPRPRRRGARATPGSRRARCSSSRARRRRSRTAPAPRRAGHGPRSPRPRRQPVRRRAAARGRRPAA